MVDGQLKSVASEIWPEHAEMCSADDWRILQGMIDSGSSEPDRLIDLPGEARDTFLASLMILYWTMRVAKLGLEIAREVEGLQGRARIEAVVDKVGDQLETTSPKMIRDRTLEIVALVLGKPTS